MSTAFNWEDILRDISYDDTSDHLKTISYRAIWANAILREGKDIENRSGASYNRLRGTFGIHASAKPPHLDKENAADYEARSGLKIDYEAVEELCGKLVGVVDIIDCFPKDRAGGSSSKWAEGGHNHIVLARPRLIHPFLPASGGTFTLNFSKADILRAADTLAAGEMPAALTHCKL